MVKIERTNKSDISYHIYVINLIGFAKVYRMVFF